MQAPVMAQVKAVLAFGKEAPPDGSLDAFAPQDPEHFGVSVQVFIGDSTDDRSDSFDLVVCSPSWMAAQVEAGGWELFQQGGLRVLPATVAVGSGIWFMRRWVRADFDTAVRSICREFSPGPDWGTVAARIGRLIPWEFDYKYDAHVNERYGQPFPGM